MDEAIDDIEKADKLVPSKHDEALVRFVAHLLIRGKTEAEVKRSLVENSLFDSSGSTSKWRTLIRQAQLVADDIKWMVVAKAEMDDVEHQRLDSFARRKRAIARLEAVITSAHDQADSVSKLNSVSFMLGGLIKAQESMDKFTGAQEAAPQVVVNVGYDPLAQFREVIQREIEVIDVEVVDEDDEDIESVADDEESDTASD